MLSFKSTFSLSSFTFIKRLFCSSLLSAIRVVSSVYLRLLIFLLAILIQREAQVVGMHLCLMHHGFHCEVPAHSPFHCLEVRELELRVKDNMELLAGSHFGNVPHLGNPNRLPHILNGEK